MPEKEETPSMSFIDAMSQNSVEVSTIDAATGEVEEPPKKRGPGRPRKRKIEEAPSHRNKSPLNSDMAYIDTYDVPTKLVGNTIMQLDDLASKINDDITYIRSSKTMKNKYLYLSNLSSALTSTLSSKMSAIKELRGMITDSNNLELKKQNQLKINEKDSDDKIIMDMYNAYLNTPVGSIPGPSSAMQVSTKIPTQFINSNTNGVPIVTVNGNSYSTDDDSGFNSFMNNLTPEQNAMVNEKNPYIETVLVYNQSDQSKWFEVIDTRTGEPVPNIPIPPDFVRDGTNVDIRHGIARNASLNQTFKLKVVGVRGNDEF